MFSVRSHKRVLPYANFIATCTVISFWVMSCNALPEAEYPMPTTETLIQPSPSATATITSIATPTALPTFSPTQVAEVVREMYEDNGGCELPCLWGIEAGKTQIHDIQGQLNQFGAFTDITRTLDNFQRVVFTTSVPDDLIGIYDDDEWSLHFLLENDMVIGLLTGITVIEEFSQPSLSGFLEKFGKPEGIWMDVIPDQVGLPDYSIALYYPSKGVFINWRDTVGSVIYEDDSGIEITVCAQNIPTLADTMIGSYPPYFYFFSPNSEIPFDEIAIQHLTLEPSYRRLDNTNVENFYNAYLEANTEVCFPFSYP